MSGTLTTGNGEVARVPWSRLKPELQAAYKRLLQGGIGNQHHIDDGKRWRDLVRLGWARQEGVVIFPNMRTAKETT